MALRTRRLLYTGCFCLLLFLLACPAKAEAKTHLEVTCSAAGGGPVIVRSSKAGLIAEIPGSWDASALVFRIEGADSFYIGDTHIMNGEPFDAAEYIGKTVTISTAKKRRIGRLTILQGSKIPGIFLTVDEKELKLVNKSKDNMIAEGHVTVTEADGTVSYDGGLTHFRGRGNATFAYSKKPYELKLEKSTAIGGIDRGRTWLLIANYLDNSLLRNQIVLDLSRQIGLPFALECAPADLWINGNYNGLYLMTEKVQIKKTRLDIFDLEEAAQAVNDQPVNTYPRYDTEDGFLPLMCGYEVPNDPEDITGGYIFTVEKPHRLNSARKPGFRTENSLSIRIKEPTCPSPAMVEYLGGLINRMQKAIMAPDGNDPETGKNYKEFLDVTSFAKKFLIEDLSKNYDAVSGSQFMFKNADRYDPLIYAGPSWDYDMSFGNVASRGGSPNKDYAAIVTVGPCNLYKQLSKQEDFMDAVAKSWREDLRPALAILLGETEAPEGSAIRSFEDYRAAIGPSAEMNFRRWPASRILTHNVTARSRNPVKELRVWEDSADGLLNWIVRRVEYMDGRYAE